ncbi:MAG: molybdate ABC transporter substrate-binding protein [Gammaproteobacteria bacterium]
MGSTARILGAWLARAALLFLITPTIVFAEGTLIAAASDVKFALEQIAIAYKGDTGSEIKLVFGSSGTLATQIRNGAPFQVFLSADEDYVLQLSKEGLTRDGGTLYGIGRIVLMAPNNSSLPVDGELKGLKAMLESGKVKRFAIANPAHAPYGRRAQEALSHAGLWDLIAPKLVLGENVSQAAQFASDGSADGGIIALSLAQSPQMQGMGTYAPIPEQWHTPLRQRMVLLRNADSAAENFYKYLQLSKARAIMRQYGFSLPEELH